MESLAARLGDLPEGGVRSMAARGTLVNGAFQIGLNLLTFLKGFIVAAFLTTGEYGIWGILSVGLLTLLWLKHVGVSDKFIQQEEEDQELAFQKAFTLELIVMGALFALMLAAVPLFALVYGLPELLLPGFAIAAVVPSLALQAPVWIYYRRMQFVRQRALLAIDPVVSFALTVALAAAGLGYWSLVIGAVAGSWLSAAAVVRSSPYPLRIRYDSETARRYVGFSWPLLMTHGSGLMIGQLAILVGELEVGLAGVAAMTLANSITRYTTQVDEVVTQTIYPVVCAVKDRADLLFEAFVKSNRLALMWGIPFGVGVTLFASDLISFAIGEKWRHAAVLLEAFGLIAAFNHIGFNWTAFYRAVGDTRPFAVVAMATLAAFCLFALPGLILYDLDGLAAGMAVTFALQIALRTRYLKRMFPDFRMLAHTARSLAPTVPAVLAVLALRLAAPGERSPELALVELAVYVAVTVAATALFERHLLREIAGYLGRRPLAARQGIAA